MAQIRIHQGSLVIELSDLEKVEALHGDLRIPLTSVRQVDVLDEPLKELRGLRVPGTAIPGRTAVGTWRSRDGKTFVVEHNRSRAIRLRLSGSDYDQVIVGTDDPEGLAATITRATRGG